MGKADIIVQIYIDDIIFGVTKDLLCEDFSKSMSSEFKIAWWES